MQLNVSEKELVLLDEILNKVSVTRSAASELASISVKIQKLLPKPPKVAKKET